jgi:Zn-dependent protease
MLDALVFYAVFVLSVTAHEAAHAWAAKLGGDPTAYNGGQVSLDPIPHIRREPMGMVLFPLITLSLWGWPFGYASAPYDPLWARRHPRRAAWMALAGPGANLALLLLVAAAIRIGIGAGAFEAPDVVSFGQVTTAVGTDTVSALGFFLSLLFSMNLLLLLLNMLPVPPLDGSGALPLVLPERWSHAYQELVRQPMLGWVGLFVAWQLFGAIFSPCFLFAINLLYPGHHYGS